MLLLSLIISTVTIMLMWYHERLWAKRMGKDYEPDTAWMLIGYAAALVPVINVIYLLFFTGKIYDHLNKYK